MMRERKEISGIPEGMDKMPYSLPAGYFDSLQEKVIDKTARRRPLHNSLVSKLAPCLAAAAVLAAIITSGILLLRNDSLNNAENTLALFKSSDLIPVTDPESIFILSSGNDSSEITSDDIINYLVYIGIEPEEFENQ